MKRISCTFICGLIGLFILIMGIGFAWFGTKNLIRMWAWEKLTLKNGSEAMTRWIQPPEPISMKVYIFNVTNPKAVSEGALPILTEIGPYVYEQHREKVNIMQLENFTLSYNLRNIIKFKQHLSGRLKETDSVTILNAPLARTSRTADCMAYCTPSELFPSPLHFCILHQLHRMVEILIKEFLRSYGSSVNFLICDGAYICTSDYSTGGGGAKKGAILSVYETVPEFVGLLDNVWQFFYPGQKNIFITTTVKEILFEGITIDCTSKITEVYIACRGLDSRKSYSVRKEGKNFKFSFFYAKNGTSSETYQVNQGIYDLKQSAQYIGMNFSPLLGIWKNYFCDMINGSDGAQFPVLVDKSKKLYIFEKELCRSVYAEFEEELYLHGVLLYKFSNTRSLFASPDENPENHCFCRTPLDLKDLVQDLRDDDSGTSEANNQNICFPSGVLPLMPCVGAPIVASFPHFYLGDQTYLNYSGLNPVKELHETYVFVEPISGITVSAFKRLQFNLEVKRIFDVEITSNLVDGLFPILWVEENLELSSDLFKLLRYSLIEKKVLENGTFALIGFGIFLVIAAYFISFFTEKSMICKGNRETFMKTEGSDVYMDIVRARLSFWQNSKIGVFPSADLELKKSNIDERQKTRLVDNFMK